MYNKVGPNSYRKRLKKMYIIIMTLAWHYRNVIHGDLVNESKEVVVVTTVTQPRAGMLSLMALKWLNS